MSRNAVAQELTELIGDIQGALDRAERLAMSSGGLVNPQWFRGARASITMAAGDLHQRGLWTPKPEEAKS